jgi:hypothetical protein
VAATFLEALLVGEAASASQRPRCQVVVGHRPLRFNLRELRDALNRLGSGDVAAYVVPLDTPPLARLMTLVTLPLRLWNAARTIERGRMIVVGKYGIDPHLAAPAFVYQLDSAASRYADRSMRPRGYAPALRKLAAKWSGCDPSVGAVVLVARKP